MFSKGFGSYMHHHFSDGHTQWVTLFTRDSYYVIVLLIIITRVDQKERRIYTGLGSGQTPPSQCVQTFRIEQDRSDIFIIPGVINCFSCALDVVGNVAWQVTWDGSLVPVSSIADVEADGNFLVIARPENYVLPGTSGRKTIICTSLVNGQTLEVRLASPILRQPLFDDVTVSEGELLKITCVTRNIPDITTFEVLDPNDQPVTTNLGVLSVPSVTRTHAGIYTCVVKSTFDNTTVSETSTVIVQYAPEVTASNSSLHNIMIGEHLCLQCSYVGVPSPNAQWFHDDVLLIDGVDGVNIQIGKNVISVLITSVEHTSGGSYTCRANNTLGNDQESYSVRIITPGQPRNVHVEGVGATVLQVTWQAPLDNGGSPILKYRITLSVIPPFSVDVGNAFSFLIRRVGLIENTTYTVGVSAANEVGFGTAALSTGRTQSIFEPQKIFDPPMSDSIFSTESSAMLTWQFPGGTVDYYVIEYVLAQDSEGFASRNAAIKTAKGSQTSAVIGNLSSGAIYKFRMAVMNSRGASQFSECGVFQTFILANTTSMSYQCTTSIVFASVLSILLALSLVTLTTITIVVCTRSKKQTPKESDVYYDTIRIGHHSEQPSVIETEVNVAYGHTKSTPNFT